MTGAAEEIDRGGGGGRRCTGGARAWWGRMSDARAGNPSSRAREPLGNHSQAPAGSPEPDEVTGADGPAQDRASWLRHETMGRGPSSMGDASPAWPMEGAARGGSFSPSP